jgi:hypothetical protein
VDGDNAALVDNGLDAARTGPNHHGSSAMTIPAANNTAMRIVEKGLPMSASGRYYMLTFHSKGDFTCGRNHVGA